MHHQSQNRQWWITMGILTLIWNTELSISHSPDHPLCFFSPSTKSSTRTNRHRSTFLISNYRNDESVLFSQSQQEEEEDWRSFRAKLVMLERQQEKQTGDEFQMMEETMTETIDVPSPSISTTRPLSEWAYESGSIIEQGSILLGRPSKIKGEGYGLGRQYMHKSVILVLEHYPHVEDEDDERFYTKGVLLNRATDLLLTDDDDEQMNEEDDSMSNYWRVWYGGNDWGIHSDEPKFFCLHSLKTEEAMDVSREVVPGLWFTSIANAKHLVSTTSATPQDFWTFSGYMSFPPNSLQDQLDDNNEDEHEWYSIATDPKTLLKELHSLEGDEDFDPRNAGIDFWTLLMSRVGRCKQQKLLENEDECFIEPHPELSTSFSYFDDLMLREWANEKLMFRENDHDDDYHSLIVDYGPSSFLPQQHQIQVGSLIRASSLFKNKKRFLLTDQEYHKSIILITQDDDNFTVGVTLNIPSSKVVDLPFMLGEDGGNRMVNLPLRYGGPYSIMNGNEKDDEKPLLFVLHMNRQMQQANIGQPIGREKQQEELLDDVGSNTIWQCTLDEAIYAIGNDMATPHDFIALSGFHVWEKNLESSTAGGGLYEEILNSNFEIVPSTSTFKVYNTLLKQKTLTKYTLDGNMMITDRAWKEAASAESGETDFCENDNVFVYKSDVKVSSLIDDASKTWVSSFLMENVDDHEEYYDELQP